MLAMVPNAPCANLANSNLFVAFGTDSEKRHIFLSDEHSDTPMPDMLAKNYPGNSHGVCGSPADMPFPNAFVRLDYHIVAPSTKYRHVEKKNTARANSASNAIRFPNSFAEHRHFG
ncbi:MAG: hypothetical protein AAB635_01645 [Patescibacteria group bacterium]